MTAVNCYGSINANEFEHYGARLTMTIRAIVGTSKQQLVDQLLHASLKLLTVVVWLSTLLFGLYILAFYVSSYTVDPESWNQSLAGLYVHGGTLANNSIGLHFFAGGVILILGCIQLLPLVRKRAPGVHRMSGRVYLLSCLVAAIGGLLFIAIRGTVGGLVMDIGFALYGALMFICSVQTYRYARRREFANHRAWALRLFALAIGSWLYRMEYGLWFMTTDAIGHQQDFSGWFDKIMAFFFYVPNLLLVEFILRSKRSRQSAKLKGLLTISFFAAASLVMIGTWAFWDLFWAKPILSFFGLS